MAKNDPPPKTAQFPGGGVGVTPLATKYCWDLKKNAGFQVLEAHQNRNIPSQPAKPTRPSEHQERKRSQPERASPRRRHTATAQATVSWSLGKKRSCGRGRGDHSTPGGPAPGSAGRCGPWRSPGRRGPRRTPSPGSTAPAHCGPPPGPGADLSPRNAGPGHLPPGVTHGQPSSGSACRSPLG